MDALERKKPGRKPTGNIRRHVMLKPELFNRVILEADKEDRLFSAIINRALTDYFDRADQFAQPIVEKL